MSLDNSEKALGLLSSAKFEEGLSAGVPSEVKVAHKFGEREESETNEIQFHDCGIIYFPNNPYLLCIMTKGNNLTNLETVLSTISKMVYEEVDSRKIR